MTAPASTHATRAKLRLALFGVAVLALALAVMVGGVLNVDSDRLQEQIKDYGALAPVVFVLISGVLGALFVPGPIFAVLAGLVFGPVLSIPLCLAGASLSALIGCEAGIRFGRKPAEAVAQARLQWLAGWLERYGLAAVVALRLAPAMPDALVNVAIGLTRLKRWQVALGTAIGSAPRSIGWALVGGTVGGASGWLGTGGAALIVATDVCGVIAVVLIARHLGIGPRTLLARLRNGTAPAAPATAATSVD